MSLTWRERKMLGIDHWSASNDMVAEWLGTYDISVMQSGEYRVWGLMKNRHQPQGEKFVGSLEEAQRVAQDDYVRRCRAEAWREYTETHDPPLVFSPDVPSTTTGLPPYRGG